YDVADWPVSYDEMEPYFNVVEAMLAVNGDRESMNQALVTSPWYQAFQTLNPDVAGYGHWRSSFSYPSPPYPQKPVGQFFFDGARAAGVTCLPIPTALVSPGSDGY